MGTILIALRVVVPTILTTSNPSRGALPYFLIAFQRGYNIHFANINISTLSCILSCCVACLFYDAAFAQFASFEHAYHCTSMYPWFATTGLLSVTDGTVCPKKTYQNNVITNTKVSFSNLCRENQKYPLNIIWR